MLICQSYLVNKYKCLIKPKNLFKLTKIGYKYNKIKQKLYFIVKEADNKSKMTSQALASLTATYTDSEGEEDMEDPTPEKDEPKETQSEPVSPKKVEDVSKPSSAPVSPKRRLVSYVDDTLVSDEEPHSPSGENQDDMRRLSMETDTDEAIPRSEPDDLQDGVAIPPEPNGKCPKELQETIAKFYSRMVNEGLDMNKIIQDKKNFRNPSIYEKLIQFCDINELDTNYPPEIYDPLKWGKESYYDELSRVQKVEMDRREKEKKEKLAKIDFLHGVAKKPIESDEEKKRKSKWDQAGPNVSSNKATMKQPGLVQQPLTSNVTGTKGTIISAFGSLPKKPKM